MFKNVATKIALFAFDTTTGAPKTGDAANLTAYVSKDYGAVTVLADTSAAEMDATNAKGWYLFDVAQGETNADALLFTGKSSTANVSVVGQYISTLPAGFTSTVAQTGDAYAVVNSGTHGNAALKTLIDTIDDFLDTEIAAILAAVDTEVAAILADTNELQTDWANGGRLDLLLDAVLEDTGTTLQGELDGIQADTEDIQTRLPAALVSGRMDSNVQAGATGVLSAALLAADAANEIADALLDRANAVETGLTLRQALMLIAAASAGKVSGAATTTVAIRNAVADSKARITATVDADGNRTAITTDVT